MLQFLSARNVGKVSWSQSWYQRILPFMQDQLRSNHFKFTLGWFEWSKTSWLFFQNPVILQVALQLVKVNELYYYLNLWNVTIVSHHLSNSRLWKLSHNCFFHLDGKHPCKNLAINRVVRLENIAGETICRSLTEPFVHWELSASSVYPPETLIN